MDGRTICVDGIAPFLRNGKCRRLSSCGLIGVCIFAFLYYTISGVGVNSLGRVRCRHFGAKSCCATITFCRNSEGIGILYSPFVKCLSDVDRIAFSAFRTRFLTFECTYTTPSKMERKSRCGATTFSAQMRKPRCSQASASRSRSTMLCFAAWRYIIAGMT